MASLFSTSFRRSNNADLAGLAVGFLFPCIQIKRILISPAAISHWNSTASMFGAVIIRTTTITMAARIDLTAPILAIPSMLPIVPVFPNRTAFRPSQIESVPIVTNIY